MKFFLKFFMVTLFICAMTESLPAKGQTNSNSSVPSTTNAPVFLNIQDKTTQPTLNKLQAELQQINQILQTPNRMNDRNVLDSLSNEAQELSDNAADLITTLKPRLEGYNQALQLVGSVPVKIDNTPANTDLAKQHKTLTQSRDTVAAQIQQASLIQLEAKGQITQIQHSLSQLQQMQLFTHIPSPLGYEFWHQLAQNHHEDRQRIKALRKDFLSLFSNTWEDGVSNRIFMIAGFIGAALMIFVLRPLIEKIITRLVEKYIPPTRLRRSLMTLIAALLSSFTAGMSATIVISTLVTQDYTEHTALDFAHYIITQLYFCGFTLGLYRGFLAVRNPQWRLLPMGDEAAQAVSILPNLYAILIFLLGILRYINDATDVSLAARQLCSAFFTCMASILFLAIPLRLRNVGRKRLINLSDKGPDLLFLFVAVAQPIFFVTCIVAVLTGYIYLGFSICVWLNWLLLVVSTLSLFNMLFHDITHLVFDPDRWLGIKMQQVGVKAQRMDQLSTIITGIISIITILLIVASILSPGNFNFSLFIYHLSDTLSSQKIGNFTISLYVIGEALLTFIIGIYCAKIIRNWLNNRFFPKTNLDKATRTSIDTILNYVCWVVIAIIVLSILGVTTQNITWIVSALSVGIGFGLQAIVQNFVSGLILLTERPVRIGDTVTISGVKGTVLSIRVRATEIELPDLSTLIVPNSQLITSSVQNSTRSRHLGVITFTLPVISVRQLETAQQIAMNILISHKEIVDSPKPTVWVSDITETALVISLKAYANTSSNLDQIKSEILSQYLTSMANINSTNAIPLPTQQKDS